MNKSRAAILVGNREALRIAAASARISTQQGTALEVFDASRGDERDLKLIDKVLASGHKSVIEHQTLSIAFNDVSVLAEQFAIECRLASFTVKSRRYVDFGAAGFVCPEGLSGARRETYEAAMEARFADYQRLLALGVPKEDARFVLPYCLRSNFFMTVNARELIALVCAMLDGRGRGFPEIESLGRQLKEQFDVLYPGVIDRERARCVGCAVPGLPAQVRDSAPDAAAVELLNAPANADAALRAALAFSGRFGAEPALNRETMSALLKDARPRELEQLSYGFRIRNISLACLTHFARHRMDSPLIPPVSEALAGGHFVLPETIRAIPEAEAVYRDAFRSQAASARRALELGMSMADVSYFAMSGHQLDILLSMNARQLLHFMQLRACSRAQWEIRGVAMEMLALLREESPAIFEGFGASCRLGPCPEGRMSCGHPWERY